MSEPMWMVLCELDIDEPEKLVRWLCWEDPESISFDYESGQWNREGYAFGVTKETEHLYFVHDNFLLPGQGVRVELHIDPVGKPFQGMIRSDD